MGNKFIKTNMENKIRDVINLRKKSYELETELFAMLEEHGVPTGVVNDVSISDIIMDCASYDTDTENTIKKISTEFIDKFIIS